MMMRMLVIVAVMTVAVFAVFVCMFFIPVFERFFRTKEERKLAKAERTANSQ